MGDPTTPQRIPRRYCASLFDFRQRRYFSPEVVAAMKEMGIEPKKTGRHSPWQNGTAERWIRSCRQELLDHVVPVSSCHLTRLVTEYRKYYHDDRTHLGQAKNTPSGRLPPSKNLDNAKVISLPRIGGLHHRYGFAQATPEKRSR